ncbi:aldehyde dehydrogenase family protein [Streptomyces sp. NPDC003247]|uniref:aldehyde dehydrogenase family protein n=1 Tax=Streptomyces sp. NPDC003247 TaxID=3364677 RepID=UPI0036C51F6F
MSTAIPRHTAHLSAAGLTGAMFIAGERGTGAGSEVRALDARTGLPLDPVHRCGGAADVRRACRAAEDAFDTYRALHPRRRARFLESVARNLTVLTDALAERAHRETGLPPPGRRLPPGRLRPGRRHRLRPRRPRPAPRRVRAW